MHRLDEANAPSPPPGIERLDEVISLLFMLVGLLAIVGLVAVGHAPFVTVWRRRHELAMGAIGLTPGQRRRSLVRQAMVPATVALAIGTLLGPTVGRVVWAAIAASIGVATDRAAPSLLGVFEPAAAAASLALALAAPRRAGGLALGPATSHRMTPTC